MNNRIKFFIIAFCTLLGVLPGRAQTSVEKYLHSFHVLVNVYGIDDFSPEPYPLEGAHVEVWALGDSTLCGSSKSGQYEGHTSVVLGSNNKKIGDLRLRVRASYLGMEPLDTIVTPNTVKRGRERLHNVNLGRCVLRSKPATIEEVEIIGELQKMYQRGDTLIFNTDAYEMPSGSLLLDLVRRLPGLSYKNGLLAYQGRSIEEMRLNGDTFFRGQVSVALNNIPSAKLKQLKVYEAKTDSFQMENDKRLVMDMVTKQPTNRVVSGNASAGKNLAAKPDFVTSADGMLYVRKGPQANGSVKHSRLPAENMVMEKNIQDAADASYHQQFGKLIVNTRHGYKHHNTATGQESVNQLFLPDKTQSMQSASRNDSRGQSYNGDVTLSNNNIGNNLQTSLKFNYEDNTSENSNTSETEGLNTSKSSGLNHSARRDVSWENKYQRFLKKGFSVQARTAVEYGDHDEESTKDQSINYLQYGGVSATSQRLLTPTENILLAAGGQLKKGIGEKRSGAYPVTFTLDYDYRFTDNSRDFMLFTGEMGSQSLSIDGEHSYKYKEHIHRHDIALAFMYMKRGLTINASAKLTPTTQWGEATYFDGQRRDTTQRALLFTPSIGIMKMGGYKELYSLRYSGRPEMASLSSLLNISNNSDPLHVLMGNSDLKRAYTHTFTTILARWGARIAANLSIVENGVSICTRYNRQTGQRVTMPMNIGGNMNGGVNFTYGTDLGDVALNTSAIYTYSRSANYVQLSGSDELQKGLSGQHNWTVAVVPSYTNKILMANLSASYTVSRRNNDYLGYGTDTRTAGVKGDVKIDLPMNFVISTALDMRNYSGYALSDANRTDWLWNASLAYKFLKKRATLSLECRDILNSVSDLTAVLTENQWSETRRIGERRCILLSFSYRFNKM